MRVCVVCVCVCGVCVCVCVCVCVPQKRLSFLGHRHSTHLSLWKNIHLAVNNTTSRLHGSFGPFSMSYGSDFQDKLGPQQHNVG